MSSSATVDVHGTTFMTDCRTQQVCYVVGFEGTTEVTSVTGVTRAARAGDCIRTSSSGISPCDEKALGLIDTWVRENLADDQELALRKGPSTPRTPKPTTAPTRRPTSRAPARTRRPKVT